MQSPITTTERGRRTEAAVLAALVAAGYDVFVPFGDGHRVDLVIRDGREYRSVQCKSGFHRKGCLLFATADRTTPRGRGYRGEADLFGVHDPAAGRTYLVPVDEVPEGYAYLRLEPAANGQARGIRWAADYEVQPS